MGWPRWIYGLNARLRSIFGSRRAERDIDDEISFHLAMQERENQRRGMDEAEARRRARLALGGVDQTKEAALDVRPLRMLQTFSRDVRYACRLIRRSPAFSLVMLVTVALGIGANTAIFSIVNAVLLRPFPYRAPEQLVILQERVSGGGLSPSYPNFVDWREQNTAFDSISAVRANESFNFTGTGEPERLQGRLVSAEFFSTLGVKPIVGRDFLPEEDRPGATPAVILSYGLWQRRFGADPGVIGQQLTLNNQRFTVVGVAPPGFQYGEEADVTVPIGLQAERFKNRGSDPGTGVVARLKPNVSRQQAVAGMNVIAARLEQQ